MKTVTLAVLALLIAMSLSIIVEAGTCTGAPSCQCVEITPTPTEVPCETAADCGSITLGPCEKVECVTIEVEGFNPQSGFCKKSSIPGCPGGGSPGGGGVGVCRPDPEYKDKTYQQLPLNWKYRTCTNSQACRIRENIEKFSRYKVQTTDSTGFHQPGEDLICTPLTPNMDPPFKVGQCICGVEVESTPVPQQAAAPQAQKPALPPVAALPRVQTPATKTCVCSGTCSITRNVVGTDTGICSDNLPTGKNCKEFCEGEGFFAKLKGVCPPGEEITEPEGTHTGEFCSKMCVCNSRCAIAGNEVGTLIPPGTNICQTAGNGGDCTELCKDKVKGLCPSKQVSGAKGTCIGGSCRCSAVCVIAGAFVGTPTNHCCTGDEKKNGCTEFCRNNKIFETILGCRGEFFAGSEVGTCNGAGCEAVNQAEAAAGIPARPELPVQAATGAYQGKTNTSGALIGGVILVFVLFVAMLILVYRPKPPKFSWHTVQEDIKKVEHAIGNRLGKHKK